MQSYGQTYIHLVADLQLYKVAIQLKWSDPMRWKHLIVRPGGMHTLMSFLDCIGNLMIGTGLEELLGVAYKGVSSMLNGKAWPKAVRGLHMVVTEVLRDFISGNTTHESLEEQLASYRTSHMGRLWVDCLVPPVYLAHLFIRAEREANYVLHMYCLTRMLPYFFAAGHWNYARYLSWHIYEFLTQLDEVALSPFYMGSHVCRHRDGTWNAVFSDQFGEQTYIRQCKARGGLVGMTLSPDQVARWILSYHTCNIIYVSMDQMVDEQDDEHDMQTDYHKEEGTRRRRLDTENRMKIHLEFQKNLHPLKQDCEGALFNIVNGHVVDMNKINVHNALQIGEHMSAEFEDNMSETLQFILKSSQWNQ